MESIQKIILIAGIPSSGKTTFSRILKNITNLDIIETDYIYFDIADILGIKDIKSFPNCPEWWKVDELTRYNLKKMKYSERLTDKSIIIEGFGLCFRQDRDIIKDLFPNAEITFLFKKVNYQQWLEFKNKSCCKLDCERTRHEYEDLMNKVELDNSVIFI